MRSSSYEECQEHSGFRAVEISEGPGVEGSFCQSARIESFQPPILGGAVTSNKVTYIKRPTVIRYEPNNNLDCETKNLCNGLSVGLKHLKSLIMQWVFGTLFQFTGQQTVQ